jgi:hypothetical protein
MDPGRAHGQLERDADLADDALRRVAAEQRGQDHDAADDP